MQRLISSSARGERRKGPFGGPCTSGQPSAQGRLHEGVYCDTKEPNSALRKVARVA